MKILMVNKFLFNKGGAETYMIKLGEYLKSQGNEVQYFGMYSEDLCAENEVKEYVSNMDFRNGSTLSKITYPFKVIYSFEARRKIGKVLDNFKPDIVHLNNINYQLTPSIIYEVKKRNIPIVQTVHDAQIVCPSHRLFNEQTGKICERCVNGTYINCLKEKCIQGSFLKSLTASIESYYYHARKTYNLIDHFICPSNFIADKIKNSSIDKSKITVLCNFTDKVESDFLKNNSDEKYIVYFGRLSIEKGIGTLIEACKELENIKFIIAGSGPLEEQIKNLPNVKYVGFKTGEELKNLISNACLSLAPSEWYENCPLSIIESQMLGTPVLASDLGGNKELIIEGKTGEKFSAGNVSELKTKIQDLWNSPEKLQYMREECLKNKENSIDRYYKKLMGIYEKLV